MKCRVIEIKKFENVLLASDFDGTLKTDDGEIPRDVLEAIEYFEENGVQYVSFTYTMPSSAGENDTGVVFIKGTPNA